MATANVLTLRPGEERVSIEGSARRLMLEEQFGDAGIHFVGVQEARSPQSEVRKGRRFTRVAAAADPGGSGGVELWVNPDLRVDLDSIFVLHSSPRLLVVSLVWESQLACFAVLHAPDLAYGAEAGAQWWAEATATLQQVRPAGSPLFIFGDTNARVGSVQSVFVGGHQPDHETVAGEHFHQFLADLDLAVPATFSTEGEGWTWQSNCGRRHRIDYVMCPVSWLAAVVRAEVPESVSIALEDRLDHRLAWVDFAVDPPRQGGPAALYGGRFHAAHQQASPAAARCCGGTAAQVELGPFPPAWLAGRPLRAGHGLPSPPVHA